MQQPNRILVASDLDGTLIPSRNTGNARRAVVEFRRVVASSEGRVLLAYVTGRHLTLALEGVSGWGLPEPDYLVCDVGTAVYRRDGTDFAMDGAYAALMREALGGSDAAGVTRLLGRVAELELQPPENQGAFKASFFFPWDRRMAVEESVPARLAEEGVSGEVVVSRDPVTGHGLLDVLPPGGAKDRALGYLRGALSLSPDEVVFAGDSGNDRRALLSGVRGILVGNADEGLKASILAEARALGVEERLYMARGEAAEGVVEGLGRWGVVG